MSNDNVPAEWTNAVAAFVAPHVAAGTPIDQAIERGILDYVACLEKLAAGAAHVEMRYESSEAAFFRAFKDRFAGDIYDALRAKAQTR